MSEKGDRVVGVLRTRSYLAAYKRNPSVSLRSVMSKPYIVREKAKIDALLNIMRQHKLQVALVQDSQRKIVGLVTIEDILEELVGEIFDEEDVVDQNFQALGGNKYLVNTHMLVGNAYERMGIERVPRNIASKPLLSFILEVLGRLPEEDEEFLYENLAFTAQSVVDGRASEVIIHILDEEDLKERLSGQDGEAVRA